MVYDITERVHEAWRYFDKLLDERLALIAEKSGVPRENLIKINPLDFCEKNQNQLIRGYKYRNIREFMRENKQDHTYLISPCDSIEETAAQISYKDGNDIWRTIRASKCEVLPISKELSLDFFIRNHRQSAPHFSKNGISYGLVYKDELVAVMFYDISRGAVRGRNEKYELVRLSIAKGTRIHGAASKLQKACEAALISIDEHEIYSYSNATINNGAVYEKLGFSVSKIEGGQPFVVLNNNRITRLINLYPYSTDKELAKHGWIKVKLGGNRTHKKVIDGQGNVEGDNSSSM